MTTPTAALHAILSADVTLAALLPGGVYKGIPEITRQHAPAAFDANSELRPCALVKAQTERDTGPRRIAGAQLVGVWVYHRTDDEAIEAALDRIDALLRRRQLNGGMWDAARASVTLGWRDEALRARGGVVRYEVTIYRG